MFFKNKILEAKIFPENTSISWQYAFMMRNPEQIKKFLENLDIYVTRTTSLIIMRENYKNRFLQYALFEKDPVLVDLFLEDDEERIEFYIFSGAILEYISIFYVVYMYQRYTIIIKKNE
jgi:hypothetical protein